jgi:hypothetical protein
MEGEGEGPVGGAGRSRRRRGRTGWSLPCSRPGPGWMRRSSLPSPRPQSSSIAVLEEDVEGGGRGGEKQERKRANTGRERPRGHTCGRAPLLPVAMEQGTRWWWSSSSSPSHTKDRRRILLSRGSRRRCTRIRDRDGETARARPLSRRAAASIPSAAAMPASSGTPLSPAAHPPRR